MDKDTTSENLTPETPENKPEDSALEAKEAEVEPTAADKAEVEATESMTEATEPAAEATEPTAEATEPTAEVTESPTVDLSALQGFDFGTSWSESKSSGGGGRSERRHGKGGRTPGGGTDRKDRRPFKPGSFRQAPRRDGNDQARRGDHTYSPGRRPMGRPEAPKKVVEVSFYPEDNGFKALCKALRISTITYELFDIARTILEKDERFYMIIRPVDPSGAPSDDLSLYVVESDGLPFLSEATAKQHALSDCLGHFFTTETTEVEAPSGSFSAIRKCGVTGELLGPPNFHRIKKIMADHHATRLSNMSFAKFESRIESVTEEEVIAEWLEKMKVQTTYALKSEFGEPRTFEDGETARAFVNANLSGKMVRELKSVRVEGAQISKVKDELLKANLDFAWERQKKFPLDTANLLRGRLRRQKFALYKKGAKGVSFVCAVKRRFREADESFSDKIQELLKFLDANPNIAVKDLAEKFLGFATHGAEGEDPIELSDEQQKKLKVMTLDFQWLLKEGYIAEYSNGTIFANPTAGPGQGVVSGKTVKPASKAATKEEASKKKEVAPVAIPKTEKEIVSEEPKTEEKAESMDASNSDSSEDETSVEQTSESQPEQVEEEAKVADSEPEPSEETEPEVAKEVVRESKEDSSEENTDATEKSGEGVVNEVGEDVKEESVSESSDTVEAASEDKPSSEDPETELKEPAKN